MEQDDEDLDAAVRLQLAELRRASPLSATEFASALGISESALYGMDSGRRTKRGLPLVKIKRYAEVLGRDVLLFLPPKARDWDYVQLPKNLLVALRFMKAAPEERRADIERFASLAATLPPEDYALLSSFVASLEKRHRPSLVEGPR